MAVRSFSVCRIGDQILRVYGSTGECYTQGYYQLREIASCFQGRMDKFTVFGRLARHDPEKNLDFRIPREIVPRFAVAGVPLGMGTIMHRIVGVPRLVRNLRRCVAMNDINWFMLPSIGGLIGLLSARGPGIRVAQMVGDWETLALRGVHPRLVDFLGQLTEWALKRADLAVFVSEQLRHRFGSQLNVPTMVANESRLAVSMIRQVDRRQVHSPVRLLFAGRLSPEKGVIVLLKAFARLAADIPCELWVAGTGGQEEELHATARKLGVDSLIRWLGWVPWGEDLFSVMREADLLVLPSFTEGLPLVLVDAMSQSLPIVASSCGGIPELIRDGKNGLLVNPGDVRGFMEAIRRVIRDDDLRMSMVANGLMTAFQNTLEENTGKVVREMIHLAESRVRTSAWPASG